MATIYLSSVPWSRSGIDFPLLSPAELITRLTNNEQILSTFTGVSFVKGGSFELPVPYTRYQADCNYCLFNNGSGNNTLIAAFITDMEWTSNNSTRFYYEIDPIVTWGYKMAVSGVRTRQRLVSTTNGAALYSGDYVGVGYKVLNRAYNLQHVRGNDCLAVYLNPNAFSQISDVKNSTGGSELQTTFICIYVISAEDYDAYYSLLHGIAIGQPEVAYAYVIPSELLNTSSRQIEINGHSYYTFNYRSSSSRTVTLQGNAQALLNNNNDLRIGIRTGGTVNYILPSELTNFTFTITETLSPSPSITIRPNWKTSTDTRCFTFSDFPTAPTNTNGLNDWLQQTSTSLVSTAVNAAIKPQTAGVAFAAEAFNATTSLLNVSYTTTPQRASAIAASGNSIVSIFSENWITGETQPLRFYDINGYPVYNLKNSPSVLSIPNTMTYDYFKFSNPIISGLPSAHAEYVQSKLSSGIRLWSTTQFNL